MPADDQTSKLKQTRKMLDVLTSVAIGDAGKEDIIALFKSERRDAPDLVTRMLSRGTTTGDDEPPSEARARRGRKSSAVDASQHQIPQVPFLLNGTLYDPADIQRFNGQALHCVPSADQDYMVAIDDADVMVNWWRLLRLTSLQHYHDLRYRSDPAMERPGPGEGLRPERGDLVLFDHGTGGGVGPVPCYFIFSYVYEHANFQGDRLTLEFNRGCEGWDYAPQSYARLSAVPRGFLGFGDWNDIVSSVWVEHGTCILYEHRYFGVLEGGSTLTLTQTQGSLSPWGWNDLASSVEAF